MRGVSLGRLYAPLLEHSSISESGREKGKSSEDGKHGGTKRRSGEKG